MIETVNKIKENIENSEIEKELPVTPQPPLPSSNPSLEADAIAITDEVDAKVLETNGLFKHLPAYYNDDEDDEDDEQESSDDENTKTTKVPKNLTSTTSTTTTMISMTGINQQKTKKTRLSAKKTTTTTTTTTTSINNHNHQSSPLHHSTYNLDLKMNQILPRLFISDDVIARNKSMLVKYKITHILNLTTNIPNKFEPDITYLKLVIFDFETQNISQYFSESYDFIENALKKDEQNRVLVHCNAGISRSASFVIAYLLQKRMFKRYKDAYNYVKKARPVIEPNRGFEKQLINFEKRNRKNKGCSIM